MSVIYSRPVEELKRVISSAHFVELVAADHLGLLPDTWEQTARICAELHAVFAKRGAKLSEFRPPYGRFDKENANPAERLEQMYQGKS